MSLYWIKTLLKQPEQLFDIQSSTPLYIAHRDMLAL